MRAGPRHDGEGVAEPDRPCCGAWKGLRQSVDTLAPPSAPASPHTDTHPTHTHTHSQPPLLPWRVAEALVELEVNGHETGTNKASKALEMLSMNKHNKRKIDQVSSYMLGREWLGRARICV